MEEEILISYRGVNIDQKEYNILSDIDFDIRKGEFVYLIGKVGSGKSSFLKTIYGELNISQGEARVLDKNMRTIKPKEIAGLRRKLGIIFQDFQLLTDRNVFDNLEFVLQATGWKKKNEIESRIFEVLKLVGMENKGYKMPNELSGGEQQRIVIARAILNNPEVILADEPTGNLDPGNSMEIMKLLEEINNRGTTVLVVTHNREIVNSMKKRVITMRKGVVVSDEKEGEYHEV